MNAPLAPKLLVVGCGAIGGVVASHLLATGQDASVLTTNRAIGEALLRDGFQVASDALSAGARARAVLFDVADVNPGFDYVLLAVQPPQVRAAVESIAGKLAPHARVVCFQNGLCEELVAEIVGAERVIGAVVAWGASMSSPGRYDRTSSGGFTLGRLGGGRDAPLEVLARLLEAVGPVELTDNLPGVRWSKLGINCAVSTLGTISGTTLGRALKRRHARRLALEIVSEAVLVARAEEVRLEKVSGTVDLEWLALTPAERAAAGSSSLVAKHALILAVGARYRRLRSSMLAAIERGRPPAIDFLNGEIVRRAQRHGIPVPVNSAARDWVWAIARGERQASPESLRALYEATR
ncbi:MAG TPA: 2-dehydropantoate 2-reductase [Polyangiaceae bacterium]|nr:2-dehydropantoate 2-reductase [Polyangiaceae bacterium]